MSLLHNYRPDLLQEVFGYLDKTCASIFIAGGAVQSWKEASDVDLWFGKNARAKAITFLGGLPFYHLTKSTEKGYQNELIGNGYIPRLNKVIQVMVTDKSISDRMLDFDISTHCIAITSKGDLHMGVNYTHFKHPPKVLKVSPTTLSRYIKICNRYGHIPDITVIKQICYGDPDELGTKAEAEAHTIKLKKPYPEFVTVYPGS